MGLVLSLTASLVLLVVLWALGAKTFDALLLVVLIMVTAITVHIIIPFLPGNRARRRA